MATTGKLSGTLWLFYVDDVAIAHSTSGTVDFSADSRDTTTKDSGAFKSSAVTKLTGTCSVDGLVALDAAFGISELFAIWVAREAVTVKFSTEVADDIFYSGEANLLGYSIDAPDKDNPGLSCNFEWTGTISELTNT